MSQEPPGPSSDAQDEELTVALGAAAPRRAVSEPRRAEVVDLGPRDVEGVPLGEDREPDALPEPPAPGARPSLGRASAVMAAGTLVSRMLGFLRNFLFAAVVSTSVVADAFNVANTMPNYLLMVLNAGVLNAVLIPQITAAMKRPDGGQEYVDRLLTAAFGSIVVLTLIGTAVSPWLIMGTSSLGAARHLGILFGFICMPQVLFYGLYSVLGNVLNARDQFAAFMWAPALANVVQIIGLGAFLAQWGQQTDPRHWSTAMVWTLAGSTTLGIAAQALVLVPPLLRGGFRWHPRWGLRGSGLGEASRMLGWTLTALLISMAGGLVVQKVLTAVTQHAIARHEVVGGYTSYNFALLIFQLPHGLVTVSILTALFPQMSRTWQDGDVKGLRRLVARALSMPAVAVIPASAAIVVMAGPLVHVMLRLGPQAAPPVETALRIMAFGILGYGISVLQQRYCFARGEGRQNLWYQLFLTGIQVAFALVALLVVPPRLALPMVALGLVVANWAQSLVFMAVARRQLGGLALGQVARLWTRLVIASVLAAGTAWLVVYGMSGFGTRWLLSVLTCGLAGTAFGLVFLAIARVLHIREVEDVLGPVLRRVHLA